MIVLKNIELMLSLLSSFDYFTLIIIGDLRWLRKFRGGLMQYGGGTRWLEKSGDIDLYRIEDNALVINDEPE